MCNPYPRRFERVTERCCFDRTSLKRSSRSKSFGERGSRRASLALMRTGGRGYCRASGALGKSFFPSSFLLTETRYTPTALPALRASSNTQQDGATPCSTPVNPSTVCAANLLNCTYISDKNSRRPPASIISTATFATAVGHSRSHLAKYPIVIVGYMGIDITGRAEEEDLAHEEAPSIHGWQGVEGRYKPKQMLSLWQCQESASFMPILRSRYVPVAPIH